ncbi:MAG: hypothetical protein GY859_30130, partial [Desulfobacterales bacterium]|nr:hypothetical protein [Desulfobacterales bacterium]
ARRRDESEDEQKKGGEEAFPGALNESSIFDDSEDMIEIDMEPDLKEDPAPIEEDMIEIDTEPDLKLAPTPIEEDMIEIDAEPDLKLAPTPIEEDMIEIDAEPDLKEDPDPVETEAINHESKGGMDMSAVSDILDKFKDVEGFMAAGVFTPDGEMAAELNVTGVKFGEIGALANDVLLKSQKATEMMGMGRGNQIHIESPKAHILARCLNEATDFAATSTGRAHIHTVLVLNKDGGNVGMGKIKLNSAVEELAPNFR